MQLKTFILYSICWNLIIKFLKKIMADLRASEVSAVDRVKIKFIMIGNASVGKTSYHKCRVVNRRVASRYSTFAT